jgi:arginine N-succinyltransferase
MKEEGNLHTGNQIPSSRKQSKNGVRGHLSQQFVMRPLLGRDLDALESLAMQASDGLASLPKNRGLLKKKCDWSESSFLSDITHPNNELYYFLLEDEDQHPAGVSGIFSNVGVTDAIHSFQLKQEVHEIPSLKKRWEETLLVPSIYPGGVSEICALFLSKDYRMGGVGRLLSLSRFLFMANFPDRFQRKVMAEMRGIIDSEGRSPFWEALGRPFIHWSINDVMLMYNQDRSFIEGYMPRYPIYLSTLPEEAVLSIGQTHPSTKPALALLEREGFQQSGHVDIFDAGPKIEAILANIRVIRDSRVVRVSEIVKGNQELNSETMLIGNTQRDFRATLGYLETKGDRIHPSGGVISSEVALALQVNVGDEIRFVSLFPHGEEELSK